MPTRLASSVITASCAKLPPGRDSISFVPALLGHAEKQRQHEFLYWEFHERGFSQAALYRGRWKGIRERTPNAPLLLHDLHNDIAEKTDVAARHPEIVARLEKVALDILAKPDMKAKLTAAGFEVTAKTGKGHMERVAKEVPMYKKIIADAGIKKL